jgi:dipeptidyl aminopeptidase/acylaminoacyl peptidase
LYGSEPGLVDVDWDLEAGYEYLLTTYGFIDPERTVALGASYGGYMVESRGVGLTVD